MSKFAFNCNTDQELKIELESLVRDYTACAGYVLCKETRQKHLQKARRSQRTLDTLNARLSLFGNIHLSDGYSGYCARLDSNNPHNNKVVYSINWETGHTTMYSYSMLRDMVTVEGVAF